MKATFGHAVKHLNISIAPSSGRYAGTIALYGAAPAPPRAGALCPISLTPRFIEVFAETNTPKLF